MFPGYEFALWNGLLAPAGTPAPMVQAVNAAVNRVLADPAFAEANARQGVRLTPGAPEEFGRFLAVEIDRLREAVRLADIQPE